MTRHVFTNATITNQNSEVIAIDNAKNDLIPPDQRTGVKEELVGIGESLIRPYSKQLENNLKVLTDCQFEAVKKYLKV